MKSVIGVSTNAGHSATLDSVVKLLRFIDCPADHRRLGRRVDRQQPAPDLPAIEDRLMTTAFWCWRRRAATRRTRGRRG
jgi:hypothetical protein